jgi:C_GCAxxG_C_C family probable redox protein
MTHKEKAVQLFNKHFHCSQAVLAAYAKECGITEEQALKLGSCFGSGMRKGEVCGACTGALMVLGLLYGQHVSTDMKSRQRANEVNDKMMKLFAEKSGSYICNDLLGCDISTSEGVQFARDNNLFTEFCPTMVANAVDALEEIIIEEKAKT